MESGYDASVEDGNAVRSSVRSRLSEAASPWRLRLHRWRSMVGSPKTLPWLVLGGGIITTTECDCDDNPKKRPPPKGDPQSPSNACVKK